MKPVSFLCKASLLMALSLYLLVHPCVQAQNLPQGMMNIPYKNPDQLFRTSPPLPFYADYDVVFCKLDLHLERNTTYVDGEVTTHAVSKLAGLSVYRCELVSDLQIDSVFHNGNPVTYQHSGDTVSVALSPALPIGQAFSILIRYHGFPPTGGFFAGISSEVSAQWGNEVTWTLSEPFNAKQWWPCKQDLTDKIDSAWVFITTDASNKAGSNGVLTAITPMPNGKLRYEWKTRYPIDYYLISAAVADYQEYNLYAHPQGFADSILIQNYIYDAPGCLDYYKNDLELTPLFLELYSDLFGLYPFADEKYGHCQAQLGGGMEHQTMGTLGAFDFGLNCHELAHQWYGDYVTCATWSDIWINEGFATYGQYLALQYLVGQTYADAFINGVHDYVMTEPGGSVFIPPLEATDVWRIFNGRLSYNKGAAIIHALRGEINNDSIFFTVMKQILVQYGNNVLTGIDVRNLAQNISGLQLVDFFEQWYFGEGYPNFNILWSQHSDSLVFNISQTPSFPVTPLFKMYLEVLLQSPQGDTLVRFYLDEASEHFTVFAGRLISGLVIDPHRWNLYRIESIQRIEETDGSARLLLYPNPCHDMLHYLIQDINTGRYEAGIFTMQGKEIATFSMHAGFGVLDTRGLNAGVYLLVLRNGTQRTTQRFIKY